MLEDVGLPELVIHMATLAITEAGTDVRSEVGIWVYCVLLSGLYLSSGFHVSFLCLIRKWQASSSLLL